MKKSIILLISIWLLVGCQHTKFYLEDSYYNDGSINIIDDDKFNNLVKKKESFAIFIYEPSCITSNNFNEVLKEFSNKYNITIYALSYKDMKNTILKDDIKFYPSLALYNDGKLIDFLDAQDDNDTNAYKDVDGLSVWFFSFVAKK